MRVYAGRVPTIAVTALSVLAFVVGLRGACVEAQGAPVQLPANQAGGRVGGQPPVGTGIIIGRVLDATTGRPVPSAIVTITGGIAAASAPLVEMGLMSPAAAAASPGTAPRQIITDADGRFLFRDLTRGRYTLRATVAGYLSSGYGQNRPAGAVQSLELLTDDDRVADATIRAWKTATISGTVVDEAGDPMIGVRVLSMRRQATGGQVRIVGGVSATTDDRGIYRLAALAPGDYVVGIVSMQSTVPASFAEYYRQLMSSGASLSSDLMMLMLEMGGPSPQGPGFKVGDFILQNPTTGRAGSSPSGPAPGDDGRVFVYPTVFYPAAPTPKQATLVTLNPGDDRVHVDLQMKLSPTVRVSGTIVGPNGPAANLSLQLGASDEEVQGTPNLDAASTVTDGGGAFTFLGVAPGQYKLKTAQVPRAAPVSTPSQTTRVEVTGPNGMMMSMSSGGPTVTAPPPLPTAPTLWAVMPVAVGQTDVLGLAVTLQAGIKLTGHLVFEGSKEKPTGIQLQRTLIQMLPLEGRVAPTTTAVRVEPDGTFNTAGYVPGKYSVNANLYPLPGGVTGWYFKSATMGNRSISDAPFEIGADSTGDIVITFTDQTTELTGVATDAKGGPDKDADVLIFPADNMGWRQGSVNTRRMRNIRPSDKGSFTVSGLPAGDYFVAAVGGVLPADWQDAKFLERVANVAVRITLADGDKKSLSLAAKTLR